MLKSKPRESFLFFLIIAGVVALLVLNNIRVTQVKNRDSTRKKDLATTQKFLENYYTTHKSYPRANSQGQVLACDEKESPCVWGEGKFPKDPMALLSYFYATSTDGQKYHLLARIENTKDTEYSRGLEGNCGASCTYGVTSPGGNITETLK
ncbi:MAG: hypothetical protein HY376_02535 [Candidatus Blackburnbacteria bacterium]|nr:hypothetical protein [Candidatus Blackburnbacteria bacterium]